jgi:hypothetical protein
MLSENHFPEVRKMVQYGDHFPDIRKVIGETILLISTKWFKA